MSQTQLQLEHPLHRLLRLLKELGNENIDLDMIQAINPTRVDEIVEAVGVSDEYARRCVEEVERELKPNIPGLSPEDMRALRNPQQFFEAAQASDPEVLKRLLDEHLSQHAHLFQDVWVARALRALILWDVGKPKAASKEAAAAVGRFRAIGMNGQRPQCLTRTQLIAALTVGFKAETLLEIIRKRPQALA